VEVPNGLFKATLHLTVPGKTIVAEVNAKTLRRTVSALAAAGETVQNLGALLVVSCRGWSVSTKAERDDQGLGDLPA
jgi:hypothetical protein